MKKQFTFLAIASLIIFGMTQTYAQENHGGALNAFVKFGDNSSIAAHYEIQVAPNLTVSPEARVWFSGENSLALGGRADYYFDSLFGLGSNWDIWGGADAGFILDGDDDFSINLHAGVEYHLSSAIGIILEFGGGTTTAGGIGLAFHL